MKIFLAGAKNLKHLDLPVQTKIMSICRANHDILVGDCYGVDSAVQKLCADIGYPHVTVYASNGKARNNIGNWKVKNIPVEKQMQGFAFYRQKDIAMGMDADCGFMIWDGKSKGTLRNIIQLILDHKFVLIYLAPHQALIPVRDRKKLERLIERCPQETQNLYASLLPKRIPREQNQISIFS